MLLVWAAALRARLAELESGGIHAIVADWRRHSVGLGTMVSVTSPSGTFGGLAVAMLCVEAFAQRHLLQFVAGLLGAAAVALVAFLAIEAVIGHWRLAVASLLILAAVALLLANIRGFFVKR